MMDRAVHSLCSEYRSTLLMCAVLIISWFVVMPVSADHPTFSGYGRVVAGYLEEKSAKFLGYEDSLELDEESLIAIQLNHHINEEISLTGQALFHSSETRDSGIEWLYLTYQSSDNLRWKIGRQRTPFFLYSDVRDVGYAYPWMRLPTQFYDGYVFDSMDGLTLNYQKSFGDWQWESEVFLGHFKDYVTQVDFEIEIDVDNIAGIKSSFTYDNWTISGSYINAEIDILYAELKSLQAQLQNAGFEKSANAISTKSDGHYGHLALRYQDLHKFWVTEWMKISTDLMWAPKVDSIYTTFGWYLDDITIYFACATLDNKVRTVELDIPFGVSPQLDFLRGAVQNIVENPPIDELDSFSIGIRWDFTQDMAIKSDITWLDGKQNQRSLFSIKDEIIFDRDAVLYSIAWEWVF